MGKINVEAEKNELILENEFGDKVIIPAKKRQWVQKQIEKGNHADLDNYISTLPIKSDFAEEGSVVPGDPTKKVKVYTGKPEYFVQGVAPRNGERKNEDGSVSTHSMSYTSADDVHYAYPTLFQDGDKWIQLDDKDDWAAFKEAQKRKELFKFDNEEDAKKFAEGSWKTENIKEYDIDSPEYRELYNSGAITNYDKNSDTYILSKPLKEVIVTAEAPQWLKDKRNLEEQYTKDWYIDNKMPKFSRSMGVSADNMHSNSVKQYNEFINNKLAEKLLKRNPNFEKEYESHLNSGRIDYLSSQFSPKELAIIKDSSSKNKISPSFLSSLEQNLLSIGNVNPVMKLKNSNLTNEEAQKEDTPFGLLERTGELGANAVRSVFDKDYTVKQFLSGKQSDATTAEKIAFDVLNLVGAGAWGKLSKTAKLAKLEEGYQAIKAGSKVLNKTDDVGKNLPELSNTIDNQLPELPHEIILDNNTINLERLRPKNKKEMPSFDDIDLGNGLTLRNNPSRVADEKIILGKNRSIKSVLNKEKNESIDLKTWRDIDGKLYYYMSANMPSSKLKAGRAYLELEKYIPKGESILENSSLSYDSFLNILKQTKNPKFETFVKGKIPMNDNAKNNLLKIKGDSYLGSNYFNSEELANAANKELIELTNKYSLPNPSVVPVTSSSGKIKAYEIQLPNIGLKKLYTILGLTSVGTYLQSQQNNNEGKKP